MTAETRTLIAYRLQRARESLDEAALLLERNHIEDFQRKLQLVTEGRKCFYWTLAPGYRTLYFIDLAAHRADTEGHKRGYMVHPVRDSAYRSLQLIAC